MIVGNGEFESGGLFVIVGSGSVIGDSLTMDDGDMVMGIDCCDLVSVSFLGMVVLFFGYYGSNIFESVS